MFRYFRYSGLLAALVVGGMGAAACAAGQQVVTVTIKASNYSRYTLSLTGKDTIPYADTIQVPLQLDDHLITLPRDYQTLSDKPIAHTSYTQQDLTGDDSKTKIDSLKKFLIANFQMLQARAQLLKDQTAEHAFALVDQSYNFGHILRIVDKADTLLTHILPKKSNYASLLQNADNPTWNFEVWDVAKNGIRLRMGTLRITWQVIAPIDLTHPTNTPLLSFSGTTQVLQEEPNSQEQPSVQSENQEAGLRAPGRATSTKPPAESAGESPPAPPGEEGGGGNQPAGGGQPENSDQQATSFTPILGGLPNLNLSALQGPNLDVVGGFAVPNNSPGAMVGLIASMKIQNQSLRTFSLRRFGIMGGYKVDSPQQWIIAPAVQIGDRSFLYLGYGFGASGGNTRTSPVFGMAFSIGGTLGNAVSKQTTSKPDSVQIALTPNATEPYRPYSRAKTRALVITYPLTPNGKFATELTIYRTTGPAATPQTQPLCYTDLGLGYVWTTVWVPRSPGTAKLTKVIKGADCKAITAGTGTDVSKKLFQDGKQITLPLTLERGQVYFLQMR